MTSQQMLEAVEAALSQAENNRSKLNNCLIPLHGYSGVKVRHLVNNLAAVFSPYVEVGCFQGSTLIAAAYQNAGPVIGIDNFTDETKPGEYMVRTRKVLLDNLALFSEMARPSIIDASCWELRHNLAGFECCFFDGAHDFDDHLRSVTELEGWFTDDFVFVVDDYNRQNVRNGTDEGIRQAKLVVRKCLHLGADKTDDLQGWWNGIGLYVLTKARSL